MGMGYIYCLVAAAIDVFGEWIVWNRLLFSGNPRLFKLNGEVFCMWCEWFCSWWQG